MSVEILLLSVLVGLTLLGYMIAINAHGPVRLSFSYLLATLMMAGAVWAIVQYVNEGLDRQKMAEFKRLESEKLRAEQEKMVVVDKLKSQEEELLENKEMLAYSAELNDIVSRGVAFATTMATIDLHDMSAELDVLIGRASEMQRKCNAMVSEFKRVKSARQFFEASKTDIDEALAQLAGAAQYYSLYYRSEDGAQEELRERMMRQRAKRANELFKKAQMLMVSAR